jgi:hypothetical protein
MDVHLGQMLGEIDNMVTLDPACFIDDTDESGPNRSGG